jgi:hypothetical protein
VWIGSVQTQLCSRGETTSIDYTAADDRLDADGGEWWSDLIRHAISLKSKPSKDGKGIRLRLLLRCGDILEGTITSERDWHEFVFHGCPNMEDVVVSDLAPSEPSWEQRYQEITRFDSPR